MLLIHLIISKMKSQNRNFLTKGSIVFNAKSDNFELQSKGNQGLRKKKEYYRISTIFLDKMWQKTIKNDPIMIFVSFFRQPPADKNVFCFGSISATDNLQLQSFRIKNELKRENNVNCRIIWHIFSLLTSNMFTSPRYMWIFI